MPRTRTVMWRVREVSRLKRELGLNDSEVARGTGVARSMVQDHLRRIAASGMNHEQLMALDDAALDERLFGPRERRDTSRPLPDWESIERQLRGRGVTLRLLWTECLDANGKGYKYSQFLLRAGNQDCYRDQLRAALAFARRWADTWRRPSFGTRYQQVFRRGHHPPNFSLDQW